MSKELSVTGGPLKPAQRKFIELAESMYGAGAELTREQITDVAERAGVRNPSWMYWTNRKVKRGIFKVPVLNPDAKPNPTVERMMAADIPVADPTEATNSLTTLSTGNGDFCVPFKDSSYVAWGHHNDIKTAVMSGKFYPIFISGLSGNGKTVMVHQICAELNRELIRVNVTAETDEDDLLGGFRLINGETVFQPGPVIEAMERGAVLLLDEIDLASYKIMCLQPVLEGNPVLLKKINKLVVPKPGFTIIACANTKGKGDDSGRFMFTNVLNEAFLERFAVTFEQPYAGTNTEKKIVRKKLAEYGKEEPKMVDWLVGWAESIRKLFEDDGIDEIISTRRLIHIIETYDLFNNLNKAVRLCINRFDAETQEAFMDAFKANEPAPEVDPDAELDVNAEADADAILNEKLEDDDYPF